VLRKIFVFLTSRVGGTADRSCKIVEYKVAVQLARYRVLHILELMEIRGV
jgi:hypothetical protein